MVLLGLVAFGALSTVGWLFASAGRPSAPATPARFRSRSRSRHLRCSTFGNRLVRSSRSLPTAGRSCSARLSGPRSSLWIRPVAAEEYREIPGTARSHLSLLEARQHRDRILRKGQALDRCARTGSSLRRVCQLPQGVGLQGGCYAGIATTSFCSWRGTSPSIKCRRRGERRRPAFKLAQGETAHRWPWFLPDGDHFLYLAFGQPGTPRQLRVGSLDGTSTVVGPVRLECRLLRRATFSPWAAAVGCAALRPRHEARPRERASLSLPSRT